MITGGGGPVDVRAERGEWLEAAAAELRSRAHFAVFGFVLGGSSRWRLLCAPPARLPQQRRSARSFWAIAALAASATPVRHPARPPPELPFFTSICFSFAILLALGLVPGVAAVGAARPCLLAYAARAVAGLFTRPVTVVLSAAYGVTILARDRSFAPAAVRR